MAIPMEDWLRGCIYHDGRHGYVTLPIDKVHQIANYIQRTRRSTTDGLIDLRVVETDRKTDQTEPLTCDGNCWMKKQNGEWLCEHCQGKPKTEPNSSEKPNNCEHITEDGVTCAKYPACDDCLDNPLNKVKGSEGLVKGSEQTEPTISKMEQVDKDINVRSKDEAQTYVINPQEPTNDDKCFECDDFFTCGGQCNKIEDEPQKKEVEWVYNKRERLWYPYSNGELLFKDEPTTQTETQNSNLTFEKRTIDYCDVCNHKGCDNCIADGNNPYCVPSHYEPKDEPQTERSE